MTELPQDPADWSALQQLLLQALAVPTHERSAWIDSLPPAQQALREPLRRLLEVQAGIQTRPFLDATIAATEGLTPPATVLIGDLVGPYRLLQQIGDGGMGSVWLAERADGTIKRKVALKLPRMVWASDLASRMARERDILGSLEHPNIARLYDAGVDHAGRPFLALEYVEGQRLDHYCDEQRLTITARIRLFLQVLDAVQYAHTNLVLHRDLKPGNVLVNQRAEIRLLDFGIAKLMGDDSSVPPGDALSRSVSRAMTPRYASPEQVSHLRLSLASDVYSLGVMLYELLVGSAPYVTNNGSRAELEIAITDGHLRTPSRAKIDHITAERRQTTTARLLRSLRGELDAVLLKALARNTVDRYPSVEALRSDLLRWLEGHPVRAKPPSRLLAIRKFVARNAWTVGIGTTAFTAVVIAAVIAVFQAREARLESRRASATRDFLIGLFENANPELHGGRELTARDLLEDGEATLDRTNQFDSGLKADIYSSIAAAWSGIGETDKTRAATEKRLLQLERSGPSAHLLAALFSHVEACTQSGHFDEAEKYLNRIEELSKKIPLTKTQQSENYWYRGLLLLQRKQFVAAEIEFTKAINQARLVGDRPREIRGLSGRLQSRAGKGDRDQLLSDYRDAIKKLKNEKLSQFEYLSRATELVAAVFMAGEYVLGQTLVNDLAKQSEVIYGKFAESQLAIHLYWLEWALHTRRFEAPLAWINDRRSWSTKTNTRFSLQAETSISLVEAKILLASGEVDNAVRIQRALNSKKHLLTENEQLSLALIEVDGHLYRKDVRRLVAALSKSPWVSENSIEPRVGWRPYFHWYRGLALTLEGKYRTAETELRIAEMESANSFGPTHPRTSVITLNRIFVSAIGIKKDSPEMAEKINAMRHVLRRWETHIPANHPSLVQSYDMVQRLENGYFERLDAGQKFAASMIITY